MTEVVLIPLSNLYNERDSTCDARRATDAIGVARFPSSVMAMSCNSKGLLMASKYLRPPNAALERIGTQLTTKQVLHAWSGERA